MGIEFWKDKENKVINPQLFSEIADREAKKVHNAGENRNKPSQIRKFYDEVLRYDSIIKSEQGKFEEILPYINMLKAKAAYALGRKHITEEFKELISDCLSQIHNKEDFDVFVNFFESFMGYYRFYRPKEN
ncbi:MAG: type III-A CRISPR-associated protein Csm2 [Candidatus Schekmanbacteria bacterium]|nr:MAG: type III-A CRISPR-associated protein Csm2 [Candidatus Schekmanbacteria bacterium]